MHLFLQRKISADLERPADDWLRLALSHLCKAIRAVNRAVGLGLKRNSSLLAACSAHCGVVLTGATLSVLASVAASLAALGLVLETSLSIELLLASGKGELCAALFADQNLVFVHSIFPLFEQIDLPFATQKMP